MNAPQKKLGSTMDGKTPHHVPVTVSVSAWALYNAVFFLCSYALGHGIIYALDRYQVLCSQSSFLRCSLLTDAKAAVATALSIAMLCCAASQAAAAVLALLLPFQRRRVRRWDLPYLALALALTIVCNCMFAADVCRNFTADPGNIFYWMLCTMAIVFYWIVVVFDVFDLFSLE